MEQQLVTDNGVSIYHYRLPQTHSVCISLYVRTGALYETAAETAGISHFLEHIHFRRLGGRRQRDLYYALESIGADYNAVTYKEFVHFYFTCNPKYFGWLAAFAADLLGPLSVEPREFAAEKRLIISEIREKDQRNDVETFSDKYIWKGTGLEHPILGYAETVRAMTPEQIAAAKERAFNRANIFYYVTGNFTDDDIACLSAEIGRHDVSSRPDAENDDRASRPEGFAARDAYVRLSHRDYYMHDVKISFDVDFGEVRSREMIMLDSVVSGGLCSLLRAEMIEKRGLIYDISSTVEQYRNIGTYYFLFTVHKSKLTDAVRSFTDVLLAARRGITEEDMQTARVFKTDNQAELLDRPESLNWLFAFENHILGNRYRDIASFASEYENIGAPALTTLAGKTFRAHNAAMFSIGNKKGISAVKLHNILKELD